MTAGESGREPPSMFPFGVKMPIAIFVSFFLLVAIWYTAPSTLSPTRLSPAQLEAFLSSPVLLEAHKPLKAPPEQSVPVTVPSNHTALVQVEGPAAALSEEFNSTVDDSDLTGLDLEPLTPMASQRPPRSNYDFGPVPSPDVYPPQDLTTDVEESSFSDLSAIPRAPPPVNNEASSQLPSPSPTLTPDPSPPSPSSEPEEQKKRYIFPMLSSFVGTGNQLMEYKSAAVIARTLNRTLCLVPFFGGPQRHFGYLGSNHYGLHIEDRYDLEEMSRFVKFASIDECIQQCNGTLDRVWKLRQSRSSDWSYWFHNIPKESRTFDRNYGKWNCPGDIAHSLGQLNEEPMARCVGMGGAFPGLRWRGAMWAAAAYMQHTKCILDASDVFQAKALGNLSYISVHWRFEESNCNGHPLGLCFTRCNDGAVIGGGLKSPRFMDLPTVMENLRAGTGFHGAGLTKEDVSAAIYDKAVEQNVTSIYLSTDGWLRGNVSVANVRWVVEDLRKRNMTVAGLWEIQGLPNFEDGSFVVPQVMPALFGLAKSQKVSNHMIALVEQEICARSILFLGSGQSSWSLAVFEARRSRRRRLDLEENMRIEYMYSGTPLSEQDLDTAVIESIYADKHTAGPACRGSRDPVLETYEDEAPDGWLDYEACEKRIDIGGKCVRLVSGITI